MSSGEEGAGPGGSHCLDELQRVERKRMRLDESGRKRWSLTDRERHQEALEDLGVGILDPDVDQGLEMAASSQGSMLISPKRKHNIENVNPNVNSNSPRPRASPRGNRLGGWSPVCSPESALKSRSSPCHSSSEKAGAATLIELNQTINAPTEQQLYDDTPLPLLALSAACEAAASPGAASSIGSCDWPADGSPGSVKTHISRIPSSCSMDAPSSYTNEEERLEESGRRKKTADEEDSFAVVSDEVMLIVFKWLPKRTLVNCMLVCSRWHRVASDESLWQRLELGNRLLVPGALGRILARKPVIVRLASSEICRWTNASECESSRIQYLDLSMCIVDMDTLNTLLYCCPALKKLSLENVAVNERTCTVIGRCDRLETLNLSMAMGITYNGMISILGGCPWIQSLNISWCNLGSNTLSFVCNNLPTTLLRLNLAGAKSLTNEMVECLVNRCPALLDLDLSDCTSLSQAALLAVSTLRQAEHLALSRCYLMSAQAFMRLPRMQSLLYLEVWGTLQDASLAALKMSLPGVNINQFRHSAIARPTVGTRRTSVWGLRTRD